MLFWYFIPCFYLNKINKNTPQLTSKKTLPTVLGARCVYATLARHWIIAIYIHYAISPAPHSPNFCVSPSSSLFILVQFSLSLPLDLHPFCKHYRAPDFHHREKHQYQQAPNICVLEPSFYLWNGEITNAKKRNKKNKGQEDEGYWASVCTRFHQWHSVRGPRLFGPSLAFSIFHHFSRVSFLILIFVRLAALSAVKCRPLHAFHLLAFPVVVSPFSSAQCCLTHRGNGLFSTC